LKEEDTKALAQLMAINVRGLFLCMKGLIAFPGISPYNASKTVWVDDQKIELSTGETILIPVGTPHVFAAIGDQPARGLVIVAPSAFARLVITVETQDKADPLDMELFNRISAEIGDEILGSPET
jgi:Cupin domain